MSKPLPAESPPVRSRLTPIENNRRKKAINARKLARLERYSKSADRRTTILLARRPKSFLRASTRRRPKKRLCKGPKKSTGCVYKDTNRHSIYRLPLRSSSPKQLRPLHRRTRPKSSKTLVLIKRKRLKIFSLDPDSKLEGYTTDQISYIDECLTTRTDNVIDTYDCRSSRLGGSLYSDHEKNRHELRVPTETADKIENKTEVRQKLARIRNSMSKLCFFLQLDEPSSLISFEVAGYIRRVPKSPKCRRTMKNRFTREIKGGTTEGSIETGSGGYEQPDSNGVEGDRDWISQQQAEARTGAIGVIVKEFSVLLSKVQIYMGGINLIACHISYFLFSSRKGPLKVTPRIKYSIPSPLQPYVIHIIYLGPKMYSKGYFTSESKQAEYDRNNNTTNKMTTSDEGDTLDAGRENERRCDADLNADKDADKQDASSPDAFFGSDAGRDGDHVRDDTDRSKTDADRKMDADRNMDKDADKQDVSSPDASFSSAVSDIDEWEEINVEHIEWQHVWAINPWDWKPTISPRKGTIPHPRDPRGQSKLPLHKRLDPRHKIKPVCKKKTPTIIPEKWIGPWTSRDPRCQASVPTPSPSMERMQRHNQLEVRKLNNSAPKDLMSSIMNAMENLHCSTVPTYSRNSRPPKSSRVEIWPIRGPIPASPRSPTRPKGSRNIPKKEIVEAVNDPNSKRPRAPSRFLIPKPKPRKLAEDTGKDETRRAQRFKSSTPNRKIITAKKRLLSSSSEDEETKKRMDDLIKAQTLKFKPAKKKKRLHPDHGKDEVKISTTKTVKVSDPVPDPLEKSLEAIFSQPDPLAQALAQAEINPEGKKFQPVVGQQIANEIFATKPTEINLYKQAQLDSNSSVLFRIPNRTLVITDFDPEPGRPSPPPSPAPSSRRTSSSTSSDSSDSSDLEDEQAERDRDRYERHWSSDRHDSDNEPPRNVDLPLVVIPGNSHARLLTKNLLSHASVFSDPDRDHGTIESDSMPGPKNLTREGRRDKKQEEDDQQRRDKRPSSMNRGGMASNHEMTVISSDEEDDQPSAKVRKPKSGRFREAITKAYNRKVEETKSRRAIDGGDSRDNIDYDITKVGKSVDAPTAPLAAPVKHSDAPTLSLRDLLPEGLKDEAHGDESFKLSRVDFMILYRKVKNPNDQDMDLDDPTYDWDIPNQTTFEKVMDDAIVSFTAEDPLLLEVIEYSKVGWNTGVGLVGFRTDRMDDIERFGRIVKHLVLPELPLRYCLAPRKILMDTYALTIYFNGAFQKQDPQRLIFWLLHFNRTLKGRVDIIEVRKYPASHENTKRAGAKIIAFEGDKEFMDSLYRHPRDHAFTIRFGGNLYIRGGDRIDGNDPDAHQKRRPRLTQTAIRTMIGGASKSVFDEGEKMEDEYNKAAQERARKHHEKYKESKY